MTTDALPKALRDLPESAKQWQSTAEERIREQPLAAVGIGALIGFLLPLRVIGGLLGLVVRVVLALFKPALLVLAVLKITELVREQSRGTASSSVPPFGAAPEPITPAPASLPPAPLEPAPAQGI